MSERLGSEPHKFQEQVVEAIEEIKTELDTEVTNENTEHKWLNWFLESLQDRDIGFGSIHFRTKHNYYTLETILCGLSKKADLPKVDAPLDSSICRLVDFA